MAVYPADYDGMPAGYDVIPDLIGDLITKQLRRHPFEGVSFLSATFTARKTPLILADDLEIQALLWTAASKTAFHPRNCPFSWTRRPSRNQCATCFRLVANGSMDFYQRLIEIHSYLSNFGAVNQEIYGKRTFYTEFTAS